MNEAWLRVMRTIRTRANDTPRFIVYGTQDRIFFARRLALFLRAGVPILDALAFMEEDAHTLSNSYVLARMREHVAQGRTLSRSLEEFESLFGTFSIGLVRIGETSGRLHEHLEQLAVSLESQSALRQKILSALIYPAIIVVATLGITLFLALYAFPKMLPIFRGFRTELPLSTRLLLGLTEFLSHFGLLLVVALVLAAVALPFFLRIRRVRRSVDELLLRLPFMGGLAIDYEVATMCRTLATLLESGVGILPALELAQSGSKNSHYKDALAALANEVRTGKPLAAGLAAFPTLFPPLARQMIRAGEATGTLGRSLRVTAHAHEAALDEHTRNLTALVEPALMITMGLLVGFVALAIITPLYSLTQGLSLH